MDIRIKVDVEIGVNSDNRSNCTFELDLRQIKAPTNEVLNKVFNGLGDIIIKALYPGEAKS